MYIHIDPMHQILQLHHRTALSLASIHFHGVVGFGWVRTVQHYFVLFIFLGKASTFKALKLRFSYLFSFCSELKHFTLYIRVWQNGI